MTRTANVSMVLMVMLAVTIGACNKKTPPVVRPQPPVTGNTTTPPSPPRPPDPITEPMPMPPEPLKDDSLTSNSLDDLNRDSPLKPVFYDLDSSDVNADGQQILQANAAVLKRYPIWQITIEGHCDERGTAEYNLALGERRALAAKTYLVSLGIAADKVRTVSYGKEFPFDAGHEDNAWSKNRRAHFVITAK
ncbi:MAG: peptidoglycan-associated lipoprotein Pal [Acidobacteriota bacterium]|nr:peptidoglycan-associated lipoprotein Pal [Acidobacteriota bacterium]